MKAPTRDVSMTRVIHSSVSFWIAAAVLLMPLLAHAEPGLQLNQLFYDEGQPVEAYLNGSLGEGAGGRGQAANQLSPLVILVGESQRDVELLKLDDGVARLSDASGREVAISSGSASPHDGRLQLQPGEKFFALLFWQQDQRTRASIALGIRGSGKARVTVEPRLGRELQTRLDDRSGILAGDAGVVEIAADHLIYQPRDEREQRRFVQSVRGEITRTPNSRGVVAVRFDPVALYRGSMPPVLDLMGAKEPLTASSERVAAMYIAALSLQLQGYRVAVDPVLRWSAPAYASTDEDRDADPATTEDYLGAPGDLALSLLPGMREAWTYAWLFDFDRERVNVGIIDQGFAPNYDFRGLVTNHIWQCDFAQHEPSDPSACAFAGATGPAVAPQAVGNSFFGGRVWHGTGVVTAAVGILNNNYGGVGAGGQVGVPMLYRTDLRTYALQFSDSIREAANDGANIINISAGYPCRIFKVEGAPYEICNATGRAQLIHDLWASAVSLALALCGPAAPGCFSVGGFYAKDFFDLIVEAGATDLREILTDAVAEVNARGVVVIASAGNLMTNSTACAIVDCDNHDVDAYQLIPCVTPGVICVGAIGGRPGSYSNQEFMGASVDIWAPTNHTYKKPPNNDAWSPVSTQVMECCINATSGAAPVAAGVVALLEAAQPDLNPSNPNLGAAERAAIPERIRALLDLTATRTPDPNVAGLELKIIQPYALIRTATASTLPDPATFGGTDWHLDPGSVSAGGCGTDQDPAIPPTAVLNFGESCKGSIISVTPGEGPPIPPGSSTPTPGIRRDDVDVTGWRVPSDGRYKTSVTVTTPTRSKFGYVGVDGDLGVAVTGSPEGFESFVYETLPHFADQIVPLRVRGIQGSDNLYSLSMGQGTQLPPLSPDRFDVAATHPLHVPDNDTANRAAPVGTSTGTSNPDDWISGTGGAKRLSIENLNFHRSGDDDWIAINGVPADAGNDCGSMLVATAPDDIHVRLVYKRPGNPFPEHIDEHRNFASIRLSSTLPPGGEIKVRFKSESDAALEYSAQISFTPMNPVICRWARQFNSRVIVAPLSERVIRWPLAARPLDQTVHEPEALRPVALQLNHAGGPLGISGRMVSGASARVALVDVNGRPVWSRELGAREVAQTANGGLSLDVRVEHANPGAYYLLLESSDPLAELEVWRSTAKQ